MSTTPRPDPITRFADGDDAAATALVTETLAPTFDLAFHLCGDADVAGAATERACAELLAAVRAKTYDAPEPLAATARRLVDWARAEGHMPFATAFSFEDAAALGCGPTDKRLGNVAALPPDARLALVVAVATDLAEVGLGYALRASATSAEDFLRRATESIPSDAPTVRLRDLLDLRASMVRIPRGTEDRILAPYASDED